MRSGAWLVLLPLLAGCLAGHDFEGTTVAAPTWEVGSWWQWGYSNEPDGHEERVVVRLLERAQDPSGDVFYADFEWTQRESTWHRFALVRASDGAAIRIEPDAPGACVDVARWTPDGEFWPHLPFPMEVGARRQYLLDESSARPGEAERYWSEWWVSDIERVDVPAGSFEAFRVEMRTWGESSDPAAQGRLEQWDLDKASALAARPKQVLHWAPAVGQVVKAQHEDEVHDVVPMFWHEPSRVGVRRSYDQPAEFGSVEVLERFGRDADPPALLDIAEVENLRCRQEADAAAFEEAKQRRMQELSALQVVIEGPSHAEVGDEVALHARLDPPMEATWSWAWNWIGYADGATFTLNTSAPQVARVTASATVDGERVAEATHVVAVSGTAVDEGSCPLGLDNVPRSSGPRCETFLVPVGSGEFQVYVQARTSLEEGTLPCATLSAMKGSTVLGHADTDVSGLASLEARAEGAGTIAVWLEPRGSLEGGKVEYRVEVRPAPHGEDPPSTASSCFAT